MEEGELFESLCFRFPGGIDILLNDEFYCIDRLVITVLLILAFMQLEVLWDMKKSTYLFGSLHG